ncbi:nucleotide exchange factor GrpE [Actinomadura barringtoniae]|uniref:Protein GrpE n=1 Tax=Actinomadura barringtoniae TaxID=1427535 RepID=A0A939PAR5_9ACTN|nr:nucleotide exchange factor GrpE [Actinomadura barringtoniae]MBO2449186.1 nucleotide exchange factor GrpE [Actinomadura barringtoniae]
MSRPNEGEERDGPVIRDNRRIDPKTGEVRSPAAGAAGAGAAGKAGAAGAESAAEETPAMDEEAVALKTQLAERTADLQRLQAEYANYRKRVERDKGTIREHAVGGVLNELLPILDDIGRARDHDELTGGFKSVGEALEATVGKLGLEKYGEKGEPFDPTVHEALMHSYSPDVSETSVVDVLQPGYRIGERVLRPARVAVAEPGPDADESGDGQGDENE